MFLKLFSRGACIHCSSVVDLLVVVEKLFTIGSCNAFKRPFPLWTGGCCECMDCPLGQQKVAVVREGAVSGGSTVCYTYNPKSNPK